MTKRIEIKVIGSVQGVTFRSHADIKAHEMGLKGYVRNEPDGSVGIVAEGEEEDLKEFASWCYNGVRWARVDNVEVKWQKATGEFEGFEIRF